MKKLFPIKYYDTKFYIEDIDKHIGINYPLVTRLNDIIISDTYINIEEKSVQVVEPFLINGDTSLCRITKYSDNRISINKDKYYVYHIVMAFFEPLSFIGMKQCKNNKNDLIFSHLCGNNDCINYDHIYVETKEINDTRTHCHYSLRQYSSTVKEYKELYKQGAYKCFHKPVCGYIPDSFNDDFDFNKNDDVN